MNINQRIQKIRAEFCNNSNKEFAEKLQVSTQYASNITKTGKKVGDKVMNSILEAFPMINPIWLKMDEGDMLKKPEPPMEAPAQNVSDIISMPREAWEVIRDQAASLKAKDEQMNEMIAGYRDKDRQINDVIALLKEQIKKGDALSEGANYVAPRAAGE